MTPHRTTRNVRRAQLEDVNLLVELGAQTFAETFTEDNTPEDMAAYSAASFNIEILTAELLDLLSIFLVADVDGNAAGYAKIHSGEPNPESNVRNRSNWSDYTSCEMAGSGSWSSIDVTMH